MKTKLCNGCGEEKPLIDFDKRNDRTNGVQSHCKQCKKIEHQLWVANNPERKAELQRDWKRKNPKRYWCNKTLGHHRESGFIVTITTDELLNYVKEKNTCELCGKLLSFEHTKTCIDSPSLDRINNEKELTKNNIQLLCHQCNTTKGIRTKEEFFNYCIHILRRNGYDI